MRLNAKQIERISKALSEPRRMQLLERIGAKDRPTACIELRGVMPISPPTLSHHVKELETAGLVEVARQGKQMSLTLKRDVLQAYLDHLARI